MKVGANLKKMSKKLEVLKKSLDKKEISQDARFQNHFSDVASANGQPLNDKRNGRSTLNRWEKQTNALRNGEKEIEKTKNAIENEIAKIENVESVKDLIPQPILDLVESGVLNQWRKCPNRFFVVGVEHARIVWDLKKRVLLASHTLELKELNNADMWRLFATTFNALKKALNA